MDKIVGNFLLGVGLLLTSYACFAGLTLRTVDLKGKPLQEVRVGYPFKIEVAVDDVGTYTTHPTVAGLELTSVRGRETKMQIINGRRSTQFVYTVTIDKPGSYTLGPAELVHNNQRISSGTTTLVVADAGPASATKKEGSEQLFVRLVVDKQRAVIGEKIMCSLQLYCCNDAIKLHTIGEPDLSSFTVVSRKDAVQAGAKDIDGTSYSCIEWQWELVPNKEGDTTIPAFRVDYLMPFEEDNDIFNFWGPRYTQKRVYSNACSLYVQSLPPHDGPVHGLGSLTRMTASISPARACEGEGMVLTLEVEGEGDVKNVRTPELIGMPDAVRWYDSKNYCKDACASESAKKCFEYIVQGIKPGEWEIPPQRLTFFDINNRRYKELKSQPLKIVVVGQAKTFASAPAEKREDDALNDIHTNIELQTDIQPLNQTGPWSRGHERYMPFWLLLVCMLVPLVMLILWLLYTKYGRGHFRLVGGVSKKKLFARARKAVQTAQAKDAQAQLYPIFMDLFAHRLGKPVAQISDATIDSLLAQQGFSQAIRERWQEFFEQLSALVFAKTTRQHYDHELFGLALRWLDILETKL